MNRSETLFLKTKDGVRIAAAFHRAARGASGKRILVVAPGFAQHKDTPVFRALSRALTRFGEVLTVDFRGTGQSEGRYTFGAGEYRDLTAALEWARERRRRVALMGLSLGAYHAVRAAEGNPFLEDLLLVSCPTHLNGILATGGPLRQFASILADPRAMRLRFSTKPNLLFRWGWPFHAMPDVGRSALRLRCPAHFLVGEKDGLVIPDLSRRVYEALPGRKTWTVFPKGSHAEILFLQDEKFFLGWVEMALGKRNVFRGRLKRGQ